MSGFNLNMLPKQFLQRQRPPADMPPYQHQQLGAAAAAATLGSEWTTLATTSGGAGGGHQRPHPPENAAIANNLQQPLHQHQHLHHPSPQAQRIFTQLQQPQQQQPQQQQQHQQPQAPSTAPMYNGNQHPPFHALRQPGAAQPGAHPGYNSLQQQNMLQQQQINQQQQQAQQQQQQQQQHLLNLARNSNNQSLFLPPGAPNPEMARALQNISRGHIGAPQPNPLFAAANRPTNQTPQTGHLQPQPSTSTDLLNQLQSRIRTAAQNRDCQELQKAQSEIDRVLESQKPQFYELKRVLDSGHFAHSPQLETLKMHHDQKQKFIAILDSFRNAAGAEIARIIQFTNGPSGVPPGQSSHGPLRPPSVNGPSNNVPGPLHLGQPRAYSIQPTPGGPVTPGPARPPSSSPMPQPGVANSQEAQEATFRNLLRMGNLPSSLWNIQGKQIDPWILHRTVSSFGGLQQMNPQRWAMLGLQFGYPATRQIGTQPGASAEVADQLHTAYREMVSKLNAVSLSSGSLFSRGFAHPLANMPPERLQQIIAQQRQREGGQESLAGNAPGLGGPPSASQPGMPAQPSQQQQQSRLSVPGLPSQPQQSGIPGGAGIGIGSVPGQYLAPPPQANPQASVRPPPPGMQQQQPVNVSPGPLTQHDMNRPPNSEAPEAAVVLRMQEKANEIFRSQMAHNANSNMPSQPTPNMSEWLPRWSQLEIRTKFFVSRLGLFMYWFRGVQSNRAFQMAIPTAVRIYKQTEALKKNPPVFYIGLEDLNGFLGFMTQCVQQLESRMRQVRHWDPQLAGMRDLPPPQDPIAPPPTYSLAPPQPPPEAHRPSPAQMPSVPAHNVQTPTPVSQPTPGPSMPAQPLRARRGAIDLNAIHGAVAGSSPAHPVPTPPAHAQTPPGATPKTRVTSAKGARPNTRSSFSKAKANAVGPNKAPTPAAPAPSTPAAPPEPVAAPAPSAPAPNPSLKRKHEQIEAANLGPKIEEPVNKRAKTAEPPAAPQPTATTTTAALISVPPIQEPAPTAPAAPVAAQQQQMPMVVTPQQLQLSTPINPSTYTTPEAVLELVRSRGDALQNEIPSAQYEAADAGSVAETLRFIERLMSSHIKPPSSDGPSTSTAPGSTAAPKDANNTSTIPDDAYDPFEFFDYPSYAEDPSMPELEKSNLHSTVSPESNAAQDAMMKTPPSQSPKKSVTVAAPANDSAQVPSGVENSFGERLTLGEPSYYQNPDFKFEGPMSSQDPWVITPA